jgi:hypothetical protein
MSREPPSSPGQELAGALDAASGAAAGERGRQEGP